MPFAVGAARLLTREGPTHISTLAARKTRSSCIRPLDTGDGVSRQIRLGNFASTDDALLISLTCQVPGVSLVPVITTRRANHQRERHSHEARRLHARVRCSVNFSTSCGSAFFCFCSLIHHGYTN